jgi:cytochrome c
MSRVPKLFALASALAAMNSVALAGDLTAGQTLFKVCAVCHEIGEKAQNRIGPILNGLDGRPAASGPGYAYSPAMKNSEIIWGKAVFKEYLKAPREMVPGSKMRFTGLRDEQGLDDIWEFVSQFGPDGKIKPWKARVKPASEDE